MARLAKDVEREIRAALDRCVLETRGLWHEMRYLIEQSDRPGHLQLKGRPVSGEQLALAAGSSPDRVAPLLQDLVAVGLIEQAEGGVWYAPTIAQLKQVRERQRTRTNDLRVRQRAAGGVTSHACNAPVTPREARAHPPPASSLPRSPSSPPPTTLSGEAAPSPAKPAGAAGRPAKRKPAKAAAAATKRERTDQEHAERNAFNRWFSHECWPRHNNGEIYDFDSADAQKRAINHRSSWKILDGLGWKIDHAMQAADEFAWQCGQAFFRYAVPLKHLARDPEKYLRQAQIRESASSLKLARHEGSNDVRTNDAADAGRDLYTIPVHGGGRRDNGAAAGPGEAAAAG